jgi:hypothetical protein
MNPNIEQLAFEHMAQLYPHEVYALHPERFWEYFHRVEPKASKETMIEILNSTPDYAEESAPWQV